MNTTELIDLAKVCEAYTVDDGVVTTVIFGEEELQQFAERIENPLRNQIENQTLNCDAAWRYAFVMRDIAIQRDKQIEQLRGALKGMMDAYSDLCDESEPNYRSFKCRKEKWDDARKALEETK